MALFWYLFGDIDCYMRGGRSGTGRALTDALSAPGADPQAIVDDVGSATAPPGIAGLVADLIGADPNRWSAAPTWTVADWPLDWQVRYVQPAETGVDRLVLQPNVVSFLWPPAGGEGLRVLLDGVLPTLSDPHTVRYGDAVLQAADRMVMSPDGRGKVKAAMRQAGSVEAVDALAILKDIDRDLSTTKAPPPSFTVSLNDALTTVETRVDVNAAGGVHLDVGWAEVPPPRETRPAPDGHNLSFRDYPCGMFE